MPIDKSCAGESDMDRLVFADAADEEISDGNGHSANDTHTAGNRRRLVAFAGVLAAALLLVAWSAAGRGHGQGLRAASWSGGDDLAEDFSFDLEKDFKEFKQTMRGITGTCLSGDACDGNAGAVRTSCDSTGVCSTLPVAYCCTHAENKPKASYYDGEVTCTCKTTSSTLKAFKDRIKRFERGPKKMLNELKAMTGQCLTGEESCKDAGPKRAYHGKIYCCPKEYTNISAVHTPLSIMCKCK